MKGRTLVIGIILFVLLVVGAITLAMMSTINGIKEDLEKEEGAAMLFVEKEEFPTFVE